MFLNECPRDAMQGLSHFVPTDVKIAYHNALLGVGFGRLDFGSFVSPKAIPQMRDTAALLDKLDLSRSSTQLLAIVANTRGAEQASEFEQIAYLGFPLSVSETFQQRNTNKSKAEALEEIARIQNLCLRHGKQLVVYLSMAFGNPYGDPYSADAVLESGQNLLDLGIRHISLADTVGLATPDEVANLLKTVAAVWKGKVEINAHLHARPETVVPKARAAWLGGCDSLDVALGGYGGCPMAEDELVGNLDTMQVLGWMKSEGIPAGIREEALDAALDLLPAVFTPET